jgi:hypothetical protein
MDGKRSLYRVLFHTRKKKWEKDLERREVEEVNKPTKNIVMKSLLSIYCPQKCSLRFYDITGLRSRIEVRSCHANDVHTHSWISFKSL